MTETPSLSTFTTKLKEKDRFSQVINVLLNYWEIKPTLFEAKLTELALKEVQTVSTFVPWAYTESDIHHSLKKFLRAAWSRNLNVRLFVMPELGVNYPNCGIPKDLLANTSNLAVNNLGHVIYNFGAPNIFPLPSYSSPEVLKRFGNFLIKVGMVLGDVFQEAGNTQFCEVVVSNSLLNYYRIFGSKPSEHGDYSSAHVMSFRDFLDREYRLPNGSEQEIDGEQFKNQLYERYNRHRYFSHVERLLREKTDMVFARKSSMCPVRHIDLLSPENTGEFSYQNLFCELLNFKPSLSRLYEITIQAAYRNEAIFLHNSGVLRRFSDQEKSFLILSAVIYAGEICLGADDLFQLSSAFQRKLRALINFLESRCFVKQSKITYLSASKFSMEDRSFSILSKMAPGLLSVTGSLGAYARSISERLVFLDPRSVMKLYDLSQLFSVAQSGKVVAIPLPMKVAANYLGDALRFLEKFRKGKKPLRINLGISYEVFEHGLGQIVLYDPTGFWSVEPENEPIDFTQFFKSLIGLAEVSAVCSVSDSRLHLASYISQDDPGTRLLFLINPESTAIPVKLSFASPVILSSIPQSGISDLIEGPLIGKNFELGIPALGVLTVQITDASSSDWKDGEPKWT